MLAEVCDGGLFPRRFGDHKRGEVPGGDRTFEVSGEHRQSTLQISVGDGARSAASG